jgi:hypothetical protein
VLRLAVTFCRLFPAIQLYSMLICKGNIAVNTGRFDRDTCTLVQVYRCLNLLEISAAKYQTAAPVTAGQSESSCRYCGCGRACIGQADLFELSQWLTIATGTGLALWRQCSCLFLGVRRRLSNCSEPLPESREPHKGRSTENVLWFVYFMYFIYFSLNNQ